MLQKTTRIIGIVFVCALGVAVAASAAQKVPSQKSVTPQEAGTKVKDIVNTYFVQGKNAEVKEAPTEESGLYKVNVSVGNDTQPFFMTKDGKRIIFPNGIVDIAKFEESRKQQAANASVKQEVPKTEKPSVELFVMSLCPYGVKAEKEIMPVMKRFGGKVDFKIKYIVSVKGATINEVASMHGIDEAKEDVRQAAIMQYYPEKFGAYLEKIGKNSCLISCGAIKLDEYWKVAAKELQMDTKKIESFAYGQEGLNLLRQDEADAKKYGIEASPTLVINGVKSEAIYGGAQATQAAICSACSILPAECQQGVGVGS